MTRFLFPLLLFIITFTKVGNSTEEPYNPIQVKYKLSLALNSAKSEPALSLAKINQSIELAEKARDNNYIRLGYITKSKFYLINKQYNEALLAANFAYTLSLETGLEHQVLEAVLLLSEAHLAKDIKNESLEYLHRGLELSYQLKDTSSISHLLLIIPNVELEVGNVVKAMEFALNAKAFFLETGQKLPLASTNITLSSIHRKLGNISTSYDYIENAFNLLAETRNDTLLGKAYYSESYILMAEGKVSQAEKQCQKAIQLFELTSSKLNYRAQSLLGEINFKQNQRNNAAVLLSKTIQEQQKINDISGIARTHLRLARLHLNSQNYEKAIRFYNNSIQYASVAGLNDILRQAYKGLSEAQGMKGDIPKAYTNLSYYTRITDSLFNIQKISEATMLEEQAQLKVHMFEIQTRDVELVRQKELIKQQRQKQLLLYIVIFLFIVIMVFASREFLLKKRSNEKLALQKKELEKQKQIADRKTRDFTDSLNYARRIQQAILRASYKLQEFFTESFIFLYPRDIVSGDFYWVKEKQNRILFALADCTGHGVPGALMSIIGTYGLNRLVNENNLTSPSEILNHINTLFEDSLEQQEGVEIFDGMDIALCAYNPNKKELNYAGANIPLYVLRENNLPQPSNEIAAKSSTFTLYRIRPNKQPIGSYFDKKPFKNHSIQLLENDVIYLFSDGYYDQFGGPEGRKYRSTQLLKLLSEINYMPLEKQKQMLEKNFIDWKGNRKQVDDVSFMGIKI